MRISVLLLPVRTSSSLLDRLLRQIGRRSARDNRPIRLAAGRPIRRKSVRRRSPAGSRPLRPAGSRRAPPQSAWKAGGKWPWSPLHRISIKPLSARSGGSSIGGGAGGGSGFSLSWMSGSSGADCEARIFSSVSTSSSLGEPQADRARTNRHGGRADSFPLVRRRFLEQSLRTPALRGPIPAARSGRGTRPASASG